MPRRGQAIHVATTKRTYNGKVYQSHLLRRTYREGEKVKHETLGNISHLPEHIVDLVRRALKGETLAPIDDTLVIERSLPHGHIAACLGVLNKLELDHVLSSKRCRERDLVVALIVARLLNPASKLATARELSDETRLSSLGETFGVSDVSEKELYFAMDWLLRRQARIEASLAERHLKEGALVLYDVTSSYVEGRACPLAQLGHNRDGKKGKLQIVFGLLCNAEGCPVAVEVFSGSTGDPATVRNQVDKVRERFGFKRIVWVGDRGMLTDARIRDDLRPIEGLDWITALRAPAIRKLVTAGDLQLTLFDTTDMAEITSPDYPGERLIVCRNPFLAEERARKRKDLLGATEKELARIQMSVARTTRPLRGKAEIGLRVGKVLNRYKVGKHFEIRIGADTFSFVRKETQIAAEASLDGIYVIRTSVVVPEITAEEAVAAYKGLSVAERAFRSLKTIDLKVRPIFHWTSPRVRAHVFLCMLAYYVEWHMRKALAPILFDDEDKETGRKLRASIVAPAVRSPSAVAKARSKRTRDGYPVHSLRTLLKDLATLTKNRVRISGQECFYRLSVPTPLQSRAFELLDVPLSL